MKTGEAVASTERYNRKKEEIVAAATAILNRDGARGMTLADVAASVGLITTSVTYYFKKKEDLAVACFLRAIERFDALIAAASAPSDPRERVRVLLESYFALDRRIREGEEPPIAVFSDVRSLNEPYLSQVNEPYGKLFRKARGLLQSPNMEWMDRRIATARTHMLLEQLYWSVAWLPRFEIEDYPRILERMYDILSNGLSKHDAAWAPRILPGIDPEPTDAQSALRETFLMSATRLINQRGYRGASVERISEQLNVTKGSFYHHNDAKDDLVVTCFERSFEIMRRAQSMAMLEPGTWWDKLSAAAATLAEYQLSERGPLLRTSALSALPEQIRNDMVESSNRVSGRFAGMISDGIAEGTIRAVDPFIAAQMLNATLNASSAIATMLPLTQDGDGAELYAKPILMGIFTR
ncbi:MAG TPA: TetR/AcrR family transcriptional regulator [Rhizomicrobium sp.]|nr:TetR/AcrR family transcriptional regulator [Rhizomicrobium sp.]